MCCCVCYAVQVDVCVCVFVLDVCVADVHSWQVSLAGICTGRNVYATLV